MHASIHVYVCTYLCMNFVIDSAAGGGWFFFNFSAFALFLACT